MAISDEQAPEGTPERLSEYLFRQFSLAKREDEASDQIVRRTVIPNKLSVGKLYYFTQAVSGDPIIVGEGLYVYTSTGFKAL